MSALSGNNYECKVFYLETGYKAAKDKSISKSSGHLKIITYDRIIYTIGV